MTIPTAKKIALFLAGAIAVAIGSMILIVPELFYSTYGIAINVDPSSLSETRAAGGFLTAMGAFVILGAFVPAVTSASSLVAILLYLSYGLSRLLAYALDGRPSDGVIDAAIIEIAIGAGMCAIIVCERLRARRAGRPT